MNRLVLCSVVLAMCAALSSSEMCTPDQWEGEEGSIGGYVQHRKPGMIFESMKVYYDAKNKRKAAFVNYINEDYHNHFQIVMRYDNDNGDGTGMVYIVDTKKDTCWSKELEKPFRKACIPADAKYFRDNYVGLKGKGLLVSNYQVIRKDVTVFLTVQKVGDAIIPFGETVYGNIMRTAFIQPMGFSNIVGGISNATVFDIPKQCKKLSEMSLAPYLMREHHILGI